MKRKASSAQGDLFTPPPMIRGETNVSGRYVWYDRRTCNWTLDVRELFMPVEEIAAHRRRERANGAK